MKDFHNHSLFGIDDGSSSIIESKEILQKLEKEGVKEIVLTPHYIIGTNYNADNNKKKELLELLKEITNIKLYLGNEVFLDNDIIEHIKNNDISTINNSRYLLIEFSLREKMPFAHDMIFKLRSNGYVPVIAHPERYLYYEISDLENFIEEGCLFQGNITSLIGRYGDHARKRLKEMINKNMITVLGSDTHSTNVNIKDSIKELKKITNNETFNRLICDNFDKIINDEVIYE